jgi:hypothetical protein
MNIPGFSAESSLSPTVGIYRGQAGLSRSSTVEVLPMLDQICGNCEVVGGLGGIGGIGKKSCCRKEWRYDPLTQRYAPQWVCWFESCSPELKYYPWRLTF